ncbi:hypothetical protein [Rufibacter tibetensis]|uniref:Uncharacterized protein n=1 Tax=Rufibacter tibetensis TaxID=512763 RepID=A0A0P0D1S5_9BACT|nr:hypothetical protein [Rufibacter tibetensis]ALJ01038.1 hypothetical protein DC20_21140 [Rufibacter tibetensis]
MGILDIFKDDKEDSKSANNVNDDYHQRNAPGNHPDPSAKRNIGLNGETERNDQKDKLENLHIGGNELTGYGANDPDSKESDTQGPGFEYEGSYDAMDGSANGVRMNDQPLDSDTTNSEEADYNRL